MDEEAVQGVVQNSGSVHLMSSCIKYSHQECRRKYLYFVIADQFLKAAVRNFRKTDAHIFTDYRLKKPSQTRYYRKVQAQIEFIFNRKKICAMFDAKWPNDKAYIAFRKNEFNVLWCIINEIKVGEVKFLYFISNNFILYIFDL